MILIRLLSLLGVADTLFLSFTTLLGVPIPCGEEGGCEAVLSSPYATIRGIPLSVLGLSLFFILTFFSFRTAKLERKQRSLRWIFLFSFIGFLAVPLLVFLQGAVIKSWCVYCLVSSGLITLIFLLSLFLRRRMGDIPPILTIPFSLSDFLMVGAFLVLPPLIYWGLEYYIFFAPFSIPSSGEI